MGRAPFVSERRVRRPVDGEAGRKPEDVVWPIQVWADARKPHPALTSRVGMVQASVAMRERFTDAASRAKSWPMR